MWLHTSRKPHAYTETSTLLAWSNKSTSTKTTLFSFFIIIFLWFFAHKKLDKNECFLFFSLARPLFSLADNSREPGTGCFHTGVSPGEQEWMFSGTPHLKLPSHPKCLRKQKRFQFSQAESCFTSKPIDCVSWKSIYFCGSPYETTRPPYSRSRRETGL